MAGFDVKQKSPVFSGDFCLSYHFLDSSLSLPVFR